MRRRSGPLLACLFAGCLAAAPLAARPAFADEGTMPAMDMSGGMHTDHDAAATSFGKPGTPAQVTRSVTVVMHDMSFAPASVQVKAGEVIRFVVRNDSAIDHDFTLGDAPTQAEHRKEMAAAMQSGQAMHHHDGNAVSVAAGQTRELIWDFSKPERIEFACNIPGHYEAGMKGSITVAP
jgi:uncharacterized cupredoxin-like copper-binding protein